MKAFVCSAASVGSLALLLAAVAPSVMAQGSVAPQPVIGVRAAGESAPRKFISANQIAPFQSQQLDDGIPQPYDFGYNIQDEYGNNQFRQESADNHGTVKGSYGYTDALGLYRRVEYVADENGFRAEVKSNEPGVKADQPASAHYTVEEVPQNVIRTLPSSDEHHHHLHHGEVAARLRSAPKPVTSVRFAPLARASASAKAS